MGVTVIILFLFLPVSHQVFVISVILGLRSPPSSGHHNSFVSSSVIYFGATALSTTFVDSSSLTATVPTTVAGNFSVTVQTPSGGTSVNAPTFVVIGAFNAAKSTLTPTSTTIIANGITTQVLTVQVKDLNGVNYTKGGLTGANAVTITKSSGNGTISAVTDNANGTYTATVTSTTLVGDSGVFVAAIGANTVNSGGGSQTQATVNYGQGNIINITGSVNWGSITTGSGAGGLPSAADTINIQAGATSRLTAPGPMGLSPMGRLTSLMLIPPKWQPAP